MAETKAQEQNFISSGIIVIRDISYDVHPDFPGAIGQGGDTGFQSLRVAFVDEYDEEAGLLNYSINFEDEIEELMILEPRNWQPRVHNEKRPRGEETAGEFHPDDRVGAIRIVIDEKHTTKTKWNRSTRYIRESDFYMGDAHDMLRVRGVPDTVSGESPSKEGQSDTGPTTPTPVPGAGGPATSLPDADRGPRTVLDGGPDKHNKQMRLMWLVDNKFYEPAIEGGWITTGGRFTSEREDAKRDHEQVSPPGYVAQIGDIVVLTPDDVSGVTVDNDLITYSNIRHDAHFHMVPAADGRLHLTLTPPGLEPDGFLVIGEIVHDPKKANINTKLGRESGQWRPQIPVPFWKPEVYLTKYPGIDMPSFAYIPGTSAMAAVFEPGPEIPP